VTCYTQPCKLYKVKYVLDYLPQGDESSPRGRWGICAPALPEVLTLKNTPTPATSILHADIEGLARQESWNYPSVIGQLNYLAHNSRPDISFAFHQCARFSKEPKALHEKAVKRIIYYLQCTRNKPLITKPNKNLSLYAYCDIDFACVWHQ
jgi:hypothetical protein